MVVPASAVVTDDEGRVLLERRRDNDLRALPGGGTEMSDSLPGTAVREVKEETGLDVEITGLVGTYTDPRRIIASSDGEACRQFNVCFTARAIGGRLAVSEDLACGLRCHRPDSNRGFRIGANPSAVSLAAGRRMARRSLSVAAWPATALPGRICQVVPGLLRQQLRHEPLSPRRVRIWWRSYASARIKL